MQLLSKIFILVLLCVFTNFDISGGQPFIYQVKTVVIDPGHGGKDPGCSGPHSREKEIALKIGLKLGTYIENNIPGVKVIYTRKKDVFVELDQRAKIANDAKADLFISIHCNSAGTTTVTGTETYVMGLHKNQENLNTAKRENSVILLEDNYQENYDGYDPNDPATHIALKIYQSAFLEQSALFASLVEKQFKERAKRNSRGVKQAGLVVLFKSTMPSVLVESGFLTNKNEEAYLLSDDGQSYIASAIYRAFKEYKTTMEAQGVRTKVAKSQNAAQSSVIYSPSDYTTEVPDLEESDMEENEEFADRINYRIELYTSYDHVDLTEMDFNEDLKIEIEADEMGVKRYVLSETFSQKSEADKALKRYVYNGFSNAKVVTYQGMKRVD